MSFQFNFSLFYFCFLFPLSLSNHHFLSQVSFFSSHTFVVTFDLISYFLALTIITSPTHSPDPSYRNKCPSFKVEQLANNWSTTTTTTNSGKNNDKTLKFSSSVIRVLQILFLRQFFIQLLISFFCTEKKPKKKFFLAIYQ